MHLLLKPGSVYKDKSDSYQQNNVSKSKLNAGYVFETNNNERRNFPNNLSIETVTNFKHFKKFYNFPLQLYEDDPFWVPPFWYGFKVFFKKKNPFWMHSECKLFIARKNNKVVGRIAAIIDYKFLETVDEKIGYFGFF